MDDIPECEFAAKETEIFHDDLLGDGCLEAWFREQLSDAEILDRLKHFKKQARALAATLVVDARNQDDSLDGGPWEAA